MGARELTFPPRLSACYREIEKITLSATAVRVNEAALSSWDRRQTLLTFAPPTIDTEEFLRVSSAVFDLLGTGLPELREKFAALKANLPASPGAREGLVEALLRRDPRAFTFLEGQVQVPADFFAFAFSHVLRLFLGAFARQVREQVAVDCWGRGECPVCGSKPNFARIDPGGKRYLYCGLCGTEWRFVRVCCPFCGNTNPDGLGFYLFEEGAYRLETCTQCRGYLKTLDQRKKEQNDPSLFWEDVRTVPLDLTAMRLGFVNRAFSV